MVDSCSAPLWLENEDRLEDFVGTLGVNYIYWYACSASPAVVTITLMTCLVFASFFLLATTADNYFSPTLGAVCFHLGIPHHLAGVTFAALGNGAPDVFSSWAAFSQQQPNPQLALGALLGAGTFILTVVLGAVILVVGSPIAVSAPPFLRDCAFFFFTIAAIAIKAASGTPHTIGSSLAFVSIYFVYVVVVLAQHYWTFKPRVSENEDVQDARDSAAISSFWHASEAQLQRLGEPHQRSDSQEEAFEFVALRDSEEAAAEGPPVEIVENHIHPRAQADGWFSPFSETFAAEQDDENDTRRRRSSLFSDLLLPSSRSTDGEGDDLDNELNEADGAAMMRQRSFMRSQVLEDLQWRNLRMRRHAAQRLRLSQEDLRGMSWTSLGRWALEMPMTILRVATIPTIDPADWSKYLVTLHPLACTLFCLWVWQVPVLRSAWWTFVVVAGIISMTVFIFFTTHVSKPPSELWYKMGFLLSAFVCSITWIYALAAELVALLCALGQIFDVSPTLLGLTVLAWGNSCGDLVTNPAVARKGYVQMACSVCFGAPLLNILLGLGIGMIILCARNAKTGVDVPMDAVSWLSAITLLFILSGIVGSAWRNQFSLDRKLAFALFGVYALYVVLALIMS